MRRHLVGAGNDSLDFDPGIRLSSFLCIGEEKETLYPWSASPIVYPKAQRRYNSNGQRSELSSIDHPPLSSGGCSETGIAMMGTSVPPRVLMLRTVLNAPLSLPPFALRIEGGVYPSDPFMSIGHSSRDLHPLALFRDLRPPLYEME